MRGRDFKPEFKQHCCRLVENDGKKVAEVCQEFELDRQTLHRWLQDYREVGDSAFVDKSVVTRSAIVKQQEREIKRLKEEAEILKKAIAFSVQKKND